MTGNESLESGSRQIATKESGLPPEQQTALELLVSGKTLAAAARESGVTRKTIYNWLKGDPAFIAAYNRWHDEMATSAKSRLLALMDKSIDSVEKSIEAGDGRLGKRLLEKLGAAREHKVGPTDIQEAQRAKLREDLFRR